MVVISFIFVWIPGFWLLSVINFVTYFPCFIVFLQMIQSYESSAERYRLYRYWKYVGCGIGIPAILAFNLLLVFGKFLEFDTWICNI